MSIIKKKHISSQKGNGLVVVDGVFYSVGGDVQRISRRVPCGSLVKENPDECNVFKTGKLSKTKEGKLMS